MGVAQQSSRKTGTALSATTTQGSHAIAVSFCGLRNRAVARLAPSLQRLGHKAATPLQCHCRSCATEQSQDGPRPCSDYDTRQPRLCSVIVGVVQQSSRKTGTVIAATRTQGSHAFAVSLLELRNRAVARRAPSLQPLRHKAATPLQCHFWSCATEQSQDGPRLCSD